MSQPKRTENGYETVNRLNSESWKKSITDGGLRDHKQTFPRHEGA